MGLQPAGVTHNNLAGDAHHLFFHVKPSNQSTITGVEPCHKKSGRHWFTENRVILFQPFAHSNLNTTH